MFAVDEFPVIMRFSRSVRDIDEIVMNIWNSLGHFLHSFVQLVAAVFELVHAEPFLIVGRQGLSVQILDGVGLSPRMDRVAERVEELTDEFLGLEVFAVADRVVGGVDELNEPVPVRHLAKQKRLPANKRGGMEC